MNRTEVNEQKEKDNFGSCDVQWTCLCSSCLSNYVDINNGHSVVNYIWVQLDITLWITILHRGKELWTCH